MPAVGMPKNVSLNPISGHPRPKAEASTAALANRRPPRALNFSVLRSIPTLRGLMTSTLRRGWIACVGKIKVWPKNWPHQDAQASERTPNERDPPKRH